MRFTCRRVDTSFFDTAPMCFKNVVELDAPPAMAHLKVLLKDVV